MIATECFSTTGVDVSKRVDFWNRVGCETYSQLVIEPRRALPLDAALMRRQYGGSWLTHVSTSPATVHGLSWDQAHGDPEYASVAFQDDGTSDLEQDGKRVSMNAGDLSLLLLSRPYTLAFTEPTRLIILKLPVARLAARVGDPARLVSVRIASRDAALLGNFARTLASQADDPHEPGWHEAVSDILFDLVALAFRGQSVAPQPRSSVGERWQRTVRDFVDRHLADPDLGAATISARLGVTPRYVQMVFAGMATTASAFIIGRRLELAAQLLAGGRQRVCDVAFATGFTDLSYFYRCFRKRFGMPPRAYVAH